MEKAESSIENNFCAVDSLKIGFDDIARRRIKKQLELSPPGNSLSAEENELLMFLLSQSILY